jgi:hypothetical protein
MPRFKPTGNDESNRYADEVASLTAKNVAGNSWAGQRRLRLSMGEFGEQELRPRRPRLGKGFPRKGYPRPGPTGSAGLKRN